MKLFEILDVKQINHPKNTKMKPDTQSERKEKEHSRKVKQVLNKSGHERIIGTGNEAMVFHSKRAQNAGTVTKWLRNQPTDYATNKVIQYLIQSQQINSTFAPRVYSITQFKRPNGLYEFSIQMEKLSMSLQQYYKNHLYDQSSMYQLYQQIYKDGKYPTYINGMDIDTAIYLGFKHVYSVSTPQVVDYILFLRSISDDLDLNNKNIMIRLTSVGPQLVVTDPFIGRDFK